jgi:predicted permease
MAEREMEAELQEHLLRSIELHERRGLSSGEALAAARREMGNPSVIAEDARDARGGRWLDDVRRDVRHAIRALARTPGFSTVVVITLALGFGVNSALFSMMRGAMHPTPIREPQTWVNIPSLWSYADYVYLRDSVHSLRFLSASSEQAVLIGRQGEALDAEEVAALFVSDGYFAGLRAQPGLGRLFGIDELKPPAGEPVAILSYRLWVRRFAMDSAVVGSTIRLGGGQAFTVIGVMPREFSGQSLRAPDLWLPLGARQRLPGRGNQLRSLGDDSWFNAGGREFLFLSGRIAPGSSIELVRAEVALRVAQRASYGDSTLGRDVAMYLHTADRSGINSGGDVRTAALLLGAAISVLLIASATVANLMLARATARRREMGVRLALGASRGRVVRSWLTECFVLGGGAAAIGLLLSGWTLRAFIMSDAFAGMAKGLDTALFARLVAPDLAVVAYLSGLAIVSTLVSGLVPALRATRGDALTIIRDGAGSSGARLDRVRMRSGLVVSQVALTMVLLLASGMLVRGVLHAMAIDPGFDRHEVVIVRPRLTLGGYDSVRAEMFIRDIESRASSVPGVRALARGNVPIRNVALARITRGGVSDTLEGASFAQFNAVSQSYFTTLGIEIVSGRGFTEEEVRKEAPVVVISENTVRLLFPGEEALGQIVSVRPTVRGMSELSRRGERPKPGLFESARVVGIAADAQMGRLGAVNRRYAYVPGDYWDLLVRRDAAAATAVEAGLRTLATQIDPDVVLEITSLDDAIWASSGYLEMARLTSMIGAAVGALSLLMAVVGLFGLTSYAVEQRTREFGVRMALGARAGDVVRLVTGQSLRLVGIGAVLGIAGAAAGGGVLRAMLFGVSPVDPVAYGVVVLLLAAVSFVACFVPARRATRVDPMVALRTD